MEYKKADDASVGNTVPIVLSEGTNSLKGAALAKHDRSGSTTEERFVSQRIQDTSNSNRIRSPTQSSTQIYFGHIEFPSYTFPNSILNKNLFGLADLTMNGCIIELTNTGISIFDKTKTLIYFTPKESSSGVWNLDLASFQQTENTTRKPVLNPSGGSPMAAHSIKHTTDAERVAYAHACFISPRLLKQCEMVGYTISNIP